MTSVPGFNVLASALTVICASQFNYYRYTGKTINAIGFDVHTFATPLIVRGSVQPVGTGVYKDLGLEWEKTYINIWAEQNIVQLMRGRPGDQIGWQGGRYELINHDDWQAVDGWNSIMAVRVGNE